MSAGDVTLTETERERLWDVIARVRDGAPRVPGDADTHDIIDGIIDSGWVYDVLAARTPTATGDAEEIAVAALMRSWGVADDDQDAYDSACRDVETLTPILAATGDDLHDRVEALADEFAARAERFAANFDGPHAESRARAYRSAARLTRSVLAAPCAPVVSRPEAVELGERACRHLELPDTMWRRLREAEEQAERRLALLRSVVSYDNANQSDLPLALLDGIRAESGDPQ